MFNRIKNILLVIGTVLITIIMLPFLGIFLFGLGLKKWSLKRQFIARHGVQGKTMLLVYSDSPNWKEFVEDKLLPQVEHKSVVLNLSKRSSWKGQHELEEEMIKYWLGTKEYCPAAIVVKESEPVQVIRFYKAFKDYKHGKNKLLEGHINELLTVI